MSRKQPSKSIVKRKKQGLAYQDFVASVIETMDDVVDVRTEQWIEGPDGRRDMDVLAKGKIDNFEYSILIECKDYDPKTTGKVGIELIDALDSKRHDLGVDFALMCSNSGFTSDAIRKAKRKHLGLITVLKANSPNVKVEIQEEIYTRKVKVSKIEVKFDGAHSLERIDNQVSYSDVLYSGLPIVNWVERRIGLIIARNRMTTGDIIATHQLIEPVEFVFGGIPIVISKFSFSFSLDVKWFSHLVTIDASLGIYDYIRGRIRLAPGQAQYTVKNLNINNGSPINFIPERRELGIGLLPGEFDMDFLLISGLGSLPDNQIPVLDRLIIPGDLDLQLMEK